MPLPNTRITTVATKPRTNPDHHRSRRNLAYPPLHGRECKFLNSSEGHYFICGEHQKRPTAITHTSIFSHKRRGRRTCHYSIHGEQHSPKRREQPRRKHREEPHQKEQNHIRRKREQTTHFTQRNTHPIERYQRGDMCPRSRENHRRYKWEGEEGCRYFLRIYSSPDFYLP